MNRLTRDQRMAVVKALCEGVSIRGTVRLTGVSKQSILTLILNLGRVLVNHDDAAIRDLECAHIEADEAWGFAHCKDRQVKTSTGGIDHAGSVWTWYCLDRESKMIVSWIMGSRDADHARALMYDLAERLAVPPQISTDSLGAYAGAVAEAFHGLGADHAMIHKVYHSNPDGERTYSPSVCIGCEKRAVRGNPDLKAAGTSRIERANLTLRMTQRRWTRLTNGHSKTFKHMQAAFAIHAAWYNWVRPHMTLGGKTPAMVAGLTDRQWSMGDLIALLEADERAAVGTDENKRGPYRPRKAKDSN